MSSVIQLPPDPFDGMSSSDMFTSNDLPPTSNPPPEPIYALADDPPFEQVHHPF